MNVLSFIFIISKHRSASLRPSSLSFASLRFASLCFALLRFAFFQFLVDFPEKTTLLCKFLFENFVFLLEIDKRFKKEFNFVFFTFLLFCFRHFRIRDNEFLVRGCWSFIFASLSFASLLVSSAEDVEHSS